MKYKGRIGFAIIFVVLAVVSTSLPGNTADSPGGGATTTTTEPRCGVYSCTPVLPSNSATTPTTAPPASQWTLVDDDEFNGALNTTTSSGWDVYNSPQNSTPRDPNNVKTDGNFLDLEGTYSNGKLEGSGISQKFDQKYGRWEVRARADVGAGYSPTILLWPQNDNWPAGGEIDLLESPHGNRQHAIAVAHNTTTSNFKTQGIAGNQSDWHTYAVEWLPNRITFYVDDVEQWTVTDPKLIPTTSPMHLALQNDAGCGWIECPNASTKPVTDMQVDWIKVYALQHS